MKFLFALLLLPGCLVAQSFRYRAAVESVTQSGYHRLDLPPDVLGRLQDGLGDLRLLDDKGHEVPYLLTRQTTDPATAFVPFGMIGQTSIPNGTTTLLLKRPPGQPIRSIGVVLQNTSVAKRAVLSGSPDGQRWYALDNAVVLGRISDASSTTTLQTLSFPLSDYPFFRLVINDSTSAPLNIHRVGRFGATIGQTQYTPVPGLRFTQRDSSDHHTYLLLERPTPARLDRLTIRVSRPAQFRRQADFGHNFTETILGKRRRHHRIRQSFDPLLSFTLSSTGDTTVLLPGVLTDKLCVRIANGDDPPLQISAVDGAQVTTYLTARLQAGTAYQVRFGDPATLSPQYDLAYFKDKLPDALPIATLGPLTDSSGTPLSDAPAHAEKSLRYAIWGAIGGVLLLLGFMTYRLLNETAEKPV